MNFLHIKFIQKIQEKTSQSNCNLKENNGLSKHANHSFPLVDIDLSTAPFYYQKLQKKRNANPRI